MGDARNTAALGDVQDEKANAMVSPALLPEGGTWGMNSLPRAPVRSLITVVERPVFRVIQPPLLVSATTKQSSKC